MIFKILFRKKIEEWRMQLKRADSRIAELHGQNLDLKSELITKNLRLKRLTYLLNDRIRNRKNLRIEKTAKGTDILTTLNWENNEIEIFDIKCEHFADYRSLVLWYQKPDPHTIHIVGIEGGKGSGHGSVAMTHLLDFAKENGIKRITGNLTTSDIDDHKERLFRFYEKHGFSIDRVERKIDRIM